MRARSYVGLLRLDAWGALLLLLALLGVIALASASSATAATTSISTFSSTGADPATGEAVTGGGASGPANPGDALKWVLSYRNDTGAPAQTTITDAIAGDETYVPGSLQTPPGLTPEWSTNGGSTYVTSEPASGVNAIGALGAQVGGSTGTSVPVGTPQSGFAVPTSNGDGFQPIFIGANVYNLHHHRTAGTTDTTIDCHVQASGAECPGYPFLYVSQTAGDPLGTGGDTLDTSYYPYAAVDQSSGKIYFPAGVQGSTSIGVSCIDVTNETSCGYTQLANAPGPNVDGRDVQINGGAQIGTDYYVIGTSPNAPIYCFDYTTATECPGYPVSSDPGSTTSATSVFSELQSFDGRYVFGNIATSLSSGAPRDLTCLDTTTNALCSGFPIKSYGGAIFPNGAFNVVNDVLAPTLNASGDVTGICGAAAASATSEPFDCFSLTGASLGEAPWGQLVAGDTVNYNAEGGVLNVGSKLYFAYTNDTTGTATYACWDFAIAAPCAGFVQTSSGRPIRAYTIAQEPQNPDCLWVLGDSGEFELFSATFGGTSCVNNTASETVTPASYYCDGQSGHVTGWSQIALGGITSADYNEMTVTITDANGNVVPGWDAVVVPSSQQTIDISSIPYSGTDTTLHVSVTIAWGTSAPLPATLTTTFTGDPVQVCFQTVAGAAQCGAATITNTADAVTVANNGDSDAPAGNDAGADSFALAATPSNCQATLSLTKLAAVSPVAAGSNDVYTLAVTDTGPNTANNVVVTDPLPAGETFVSGSSGCSEANGTVTCDAGSLASGAAQVFQIVVSLASSDSGLITNHASATTSTCCGPAALASATIDVLSRRWGSRTRRRRPPSPRVVR